MSAPRTTLDRHHSVNEIAELVARNILVARKLAYKDMQDRLSGAEWKLIRFAAEINYCGEKMAEIDREIAQWNRP